MHGLLQEYGIISGRGQKALKQRVWCVLKDADNELSMLMRDLIAEQMAELDRLNERLQSLDKRVEQLSHAVAPCRQLLAIKGIGPMVATQHYSALGNGDAFKKGRQASAYLGLTPTQHSSGGTASIKGIDRTGQVALKAALIRGAHSATNTAGDKQDAKNRWLRALIARVGKNKAAVALANKTVRTAWTVLHSGQSYCKEFNESSALMTS